MATFLLNMTVLSLKRKDETSINVLLTVLPDVLIHFNDSEAQYRILVTIGTLLLGTTSIEQVQVKMKLTKSDKFVQHVTLLTQKGNGDIELKRKSCALQVQRDLLL